MLVVSDTSVLVNLAVIGETRILAQLFQTVIAPQAVRDEFARLVVAETRFRGAVWPAWVSATARRDSSGAARRAGAVACR